jgi:1-deoxy-D-xylulose-5-phosphate synthase
MAIFAPMNESELRNIMYTAQEGIDHPMAIRYPRGRGVLPSWRTPFKKITIGTSRNLVQGSDIAVLSLGHIGNKVTKILNNLNNPKEIGHFDMRFVKPLDIPQLHHIFKTYQIIVTLEDGCEMGGFGSAILEFANTHQYKNNIKCLGLPDIFIEHGTVEELQALGRIDETSITNCLTQFLHEVS